MERKSSPRTKQRLLSAIVSLAACSMLFTAGLLIVGGARSSEHASLDIALRPSSGHAPCRALATTAGIAINYEPLTTALPYRPEPSYESQPLTPPLPLDHEDEEDGGL